MRKLLRSILLPCLLAASVSAAAALELPVKSINGRKYYYYEVKSGDNVFSIARQLGISRDDIIRYNPAANDRLRTGTTLYFPFEEIAPKGTTSINHEVQRNETLFGLAHRYGTTPDEIIALNPHLKNRGLRHGETIVIPTGAESDYSAQPASSPNETPLFEPEPVAQTPDPEAAPAPETAPVPETVTVPEVAPVLPVAQTEEIIAEEEVIEYKTDSIADEAENHRAVIAVVLPFGLDNPTPTKQAQLYTDFYKGMLIGADEMSNSGQNVEIKIFDSSTGSIPDDTLRISSVIIAPEDSLTISRMTAAVAETDGYVLNIFNLRDRSYASNPALIQANIPQPEMYAKAYTALRERFEGRRPVLLHNQTGRNDKQTFVNYIREHYLADGIAPVEIGYSGTLRSSDLDILDAAESYVIVPGSGSLAEFNRMSHALKAYIEDPATARVSVFGYPDWTAFRSDAREMLHTLGATIYSRVFLDPESPESINLAEAFENNFGAAPMEVVPNQGALGYDVARMLIGALRDNKGLFSPEDLGEWHGIQSAYQFHREGEEGGVVNEALYIITFNPDKTVRTTIL